MSVSRVVVRLEIADGCSSVDLQYQATEVESGLVKQSYASVVSSSASHNPLRLLQLMTREDFLIYKGRRDYHTITIETYDQDIKRTDMASFSPSVPASNDKLPLMRKEDPDRVDQTSSMAPSLHGKRASPAEDLSSCDTLITSGSDAGIAMSDASSSVSGSTENGESSIRSGNAKMLCRPPKPLASSALIHFFSGNPAVETTEGILHLYKEDHMTSVTGDVMSRSNMICMLNVPATLTSHDLIQYVAPINPGLERIKIIRGSTPNEYMVLLKFRHQVDADEFFDTFNNKPFNSIEPEICHMVYVARVESLQSSEGAGLQVPGATELPVCTVCLERMDESVDGILTILCNHSFHSSCLANWDDTSCPVCRYIQTPVAVADNRCFQCDAHENLWICLICGVVGCGRYANGHAYGHFKETAHTYSMQLGSNRVWDYTGDNYVHRLVQNKTDGKLVEVDERGNFFHEEKIDSLNLEYTYLLTSQLESQRHFFEDKIQSIEIHKNRQIEEIEGQVKKALDEITKRDQHLAQVIKEKQVAEKRTNLLTAKVNKMVTELEEEREMNRCLRENQIEWQTRVTDLEQRLAKKDEEMTELQEQLRDLMFYLEAKEKLETSDEVTQQELQEGSIVVQSSSAMSSATPSGSGRKPRKKGR